MELDLSAPYRSEALESFPLPARAISARAVAPVLDLSRGSSAPAPSRIRSDLADHRVASARADLLPGLREPLLPGYYVPGLPPRSSGGLSATPGLGPALPPSGRPSLAGLRVSAAYQSAALSQRAVPRPGYYASGLQQARLVISNALAVDTVRRQDAAAADLASWLASTGEGVGLHDVDPEFLLVYVEAAWLTEHPGRLAEQCGPDAVQGLFASLSGWFERAGRCGAYDPATGRGNPCTSVHISDYKKGYRRLAMLAGYESSSAVPMTLDKHRQLCGYFWAQVASAASLAAFMSLLRDLLCAQYMWLSTMRGKDTGKLALADFCDPDQPGRPDARLPLPPPGQWPAGQAFRLCVRERGTKTSRLSRAPAVFLDTNLAEPGLCFVRTLALYMWRGAQPDAAGFRITDFLFRPLSRNRRAFEDGPLSSGTLGAALRRHLLRAELYAGETNHSYRRGALQAAAAQGADQAALLRLGQMRSPATLQLYLDPERHLAGPAPKRARV